MPSFHPSPITLSCVHFIRPYLYHHVYYGSHHDLIISINIIIINSIVTLYSPPQYNTRNVKNAGCIYLLPCISLSDHSATDRSDPPVCSLLAPPSGSTTTTADCDLQTQCNTIKLLYVWGRGAHDHSSSIRVYLSYLGQAPSFFYPCPGTAHIYSEITDILYELGDHCFDVPNQYQFFNKESSVSFHVVVQRKTLFQPKDYT